MPMGVLATESEHWAEIFRRTYFRWGGTIWNVVGILVSGIIIIMIIPSFCKHNDPPDKKKKWTYNSTWCWCKYRWDDRQKVATKTSVFFPLYASLTVSYTDFKLQFLYSNGIILYYSMPKNENYFHILLNVKFIAS